MLKPLMHFSVGLMLLVMATLITTTLAQPPLPLPSSVRATTELLTNGGFETDTDNNKLPDGWAGKNTTSPAPDKLKCDKPEQGKFFAHTGSCAFMFKGNPNGSLSKLQQKLTDTSAIVDGASVTFGVYVDVRSAAPNTKIGLAKIKYSDNSKTKFTLAIPVTRGVEDYQLLTDTQSINLPVGVTVTSAKLDFRYNGKTGKFLLDDASFAVTDDSIVPLAKLLADDGAASDLFGYSIAIAGDTMVVGAVKDNGWQGAAYVFTRTGEVWTQQQKLTASDGAAGDEFGESVAIAGDTVVIGALYADIDGNNNRGAAYVFTRSGTTWTEQQKLISSGTLYFGRSVSIDGDTVVIGTTEAAHVFIRSDTVWAEQQKLTASDFTFGDIFGRSVSIAGDTVVVGAPQDKTGENTEQGSAYVFTRSDTTWTEQQKLTASDGAQGDWFGDSVAIAGDTVVIGVSKDDIGGGSTGQNIGSAYVFTRSGTTWTEQQKLTASNGKAGDFLGEVVAIDGDTVVVGTTIGGGFGGAAYVFTRSDSVWTEQQKLTANDGAAGDWFGDSVAIAGDTVVIGASKDDIGENTDQGSAYVFDLVP